MKQKTVFYSFMALLIVVGLSLLWLRYEQLGIPLMPETQVRVWLVEARIEFSATGDETLVNLSLPENPPGFRLLSEQAASPGYGFARISSADRRRGMVKTGSARHPEPLLQGSVRAHQGTGFAPACRRRAAGTPAGSLGGTRSHSSLGPVVRRISKLQHGGQPDPGVNQDHQQGEADQNASLLLDGRSPEQLLVRLLNQADVPARLAMGLKLEDARRNQSLTPLVDVFVDGQWQIFDRGRKAMKAFPRMCSSGTAPTAPC